MGKLQLLGELHGTDKATHHMYCDFYESVLPKDIDYLDNILEIGVKEGASLKMWRDYYPKSTILGVDVNPAIEISGTIIAKDDATILTPLKKLHAVIGFSLIIDDGSHLCSHQRKSFDIYWPMLRPGGFYIIEDVHSSFLGDYADETPTTYQWAMRLPGALEWWRDPSNKSDSGTIVIPKPL